LTSKQQRINVSAWQTKRLAARPNLFGQFRVAQAAGISSAIPGERVLRIEVVVHNTQELQCGHSLEKFPRILPPRDFQWTQGNGRACSSKKQSHKALVSRRSTPAQSRGAQNPRPIDKHYETIRTATQGVFDELGLAA
jgi:hypothetical protein